ncbi:MAG: hypothetical protein MK081_11925 [Flavobacteriales bacterium]|nr:hypothetical protein [Flavobacteriales bacterium]
MEKHLHNEAFKEEYWDDALAVLKREERKQFTRKVLSWLPPAAVVVAAVVMYFLPAEHGPAQLADNTSRDPIQYESSHEVMSTDTAPQETFYNENEVGNTTQPQNLTSNSHSHSSSSSIVFASAESDTPEQEVVADLRTGDEVKEEFELKEELELETVVESEGYGGSMLERTTKTTPTINAPTGLSLASIRGYRHVDPSGVLKFRTFEDKHRNFLRESVKPTQLMVYVGNAFAAGYGTVKGATVFNPQAGIALEQRIANGLWIRGGLGGQQLTEVRVSKDFREVTPGFGYEYSNTEISTVKLYLAELPVSLIWDANVRHSFFGGAGLEYVAVTKNELTTTEVSLFSEEVVAESEDYGYLTGFSPLMWNLHGGYRYRLTRSASLDFTYSTGLNSVVQGSDARNKRFIVRLNWRLK